MRPRSLRTSTREVLSGIIWKNCPLKIKSVSFIKHASLSPRMGLV